MIIRVQVDSSQISSVQHEDTPDADGNPANTLTVDFKRGGRFRWRYPGVDAAMFERIAHPGQEFDFSVGRAFDRLIRKTDKLAKGVDVTPDPVELSKHEPGLLG